MATPWHPFLTAELDELRSRQRRSFALLDDAVVAAVHLRVHREHRFDETELARREWALRMVIEEKRAADAVRAAFDEMERRATHNLCWEVFGDWHPDLGLVAEELLPPLEHDNETSFLLTQYAALCLRADWMAGNYQDSRVRHRDNG